MFHAFGNNPITYTDPDGRFDVPSDVKNIFDDKALKNLRKLGLEIFHKGTINGVNLYTDQGSTGDGCFARATIIAAELEKLGYMVTDYSYVVEPVKPNVVKAELAAGRDPSKVSEYDSSGNKNRFSFHVAATVIIGGKKYVVDPFYHKSWESISEQSDWYSIQYPRGAKTTEPAHDVNGNLIGPYAMRVNRSRSNFGKELSIGEYAKGWLKNYSDVTRYNQKHNTNKDPYIWSGE